MTLVGVALPAGDAEVMVECLVEEYLLLGFSRKRVLALFRQPRFCGTHQLYRDRGEARIQALIDRVYERYTASGTHGSSAHE